MFPTFTTIPYNILPMKTLVLKKKNSYRKHTKLIVILNILFLNNIRAEHVGLGVSPLVFQIDTL